MRKLLTISIIAMVISCNNQSDIEDNEAVEVETPAEEVVGDKYGIRWNFEDEFSEKEQSKLKNWIRTVYEATQETLGDYPFNLYVFFHRNDRDKAVTFGHTRRGKKQQVHFYVNPSFPLSAFIDDWIAPHEISHLSMPFVGSNAKWYAEGYATYLSRKIMMNMDLYTEAEFDSIYYHKINGVMAYYGSPTSTFQEVSDSLLSEYEYGEMYWGSTSFFMTSDSLLEVNYNTNLLNVIQEYQKCCRLKDKNLNMVMESYDEIIGDTLFTNLLWQYRNLPCCEVMKGYY